MGMGPPACWRGAGTGCKRGFPPRRGAPRSQWRPNPPSPATCLQKSDRWLSLDGAPGRQLRYGWRLMVRPITNFGTAFEIHFGARLMELHRVLIHFI